ncbi:hypothetical protein M3172_16085 [Mesobacillus subterraneus]|uniref:hypothetical protein n=1 Tax=Mesobacillus subterraneus TaxID=285983 RepID=UPI00203DE8CF|nr:hypothetical protein [Mesobacillus subterraneus]MCM3574717.1 hypothetical protein [Mesobacillus subterraneus]
MNNIEDLLLLIPAIIHNNQDKTLHRVVLYQPAITDYFNENIEVISQNFKDLLKTLSIKSEVIPIKNDNDDLYQNRLYSVVYQHPVGEEYISILYINGQFQLQEYVAMSE